MPKTIPGSSSVDVTRRPNSRGTRPFTSSRSPTVLPRLKVLAAVGAEG
jgi:hypothetical protein